MSAYGPQRICQLTAFASTFDATTLKLAADLDSLASADPPEDAKSVTVDYIFSEVVGDGYADLEIASSGAAKIGPGAVDSIPFSLAKTTGDTTTRTIELPNVAAEVDPIANGNAHGKNRALAALITQCRTALRGSLRFALPACG
jgi:hypothetical protein